MSSRNSSNPITVFALLPDPDAYLLAYSVPLLLISVVATYAGTFLTLDRTRVFPPVDHPSIDRHPTLYRLEGGIGGLIAGWLCGVHLSTYFALLALNKSATLKVPSAIQWLVIWVMSGIPLTIIGGRWRIAACTFYAIVGGASFTALVSIIFLPDDVLPRLIIFAVVTPILLVGTLLPLQWVRHAFLRACSSLAGALGMVTAIALFARIDSWANPWLIFAIRTYVGTIDSKEKGLSAALCLFAVTGAGCDWLLKLKVGEDPDKQWDAYLAKYARQLPLDSERAGSFKPYESAWSRLFSGKLFSHGGLPEKDDVLFPPDSQLLPASTSSTSTLKPPPPTVGFTTPPTFRPYPKNKRRATLTKAKSAHLSSSSDSDDSSEGEGKPPRFKPWLMKRSSTNVSAATTAVDSKEKGAYERPEYSDVEEERDVTVPEKERHSPGWKPGFLKKHEEEQIQLRRSSSGTASVKGKERERPGPESPSPITRQTTNQTLVPPSPSVPNTPSMIQAYDRIARARKEAVSPDKEASSHEVLDEGFWNVVKAKAAEFHVAPAR